MKIAHILDWEPSIYQLVVYEDGLMAALKELMSRGHEVKFFTCGKDQVIDTPLFEATVTSDMVKSVREFSPDVILHHADFTRPHAQPLRELGIPMAICFAGGEAINYNTPYFDHIFVESQVYKERLQEGGYTNVSIAFGTNTNLFKPIETQAKVFDALMPGTYAIWKRHELFAKATSDLLAVTAGYMYPDSWEKECYEVCEKAGNVVLPHVSAQTLHRLYASSKCVVVPSRSDGGSQRTVLEAMAMNVPLIVTDSDKYDYITDEVVRVEPVVDDLWHAIMDVDIKGTVVNTREHILANWSEFTYADSLEGGLKSLL